MSTHDLEDVRRDLIAEQARIKRRVSKINADLQQQDGPLSAHSEEQAVQLENDEVLAHLDDAGRLQLTQITSAIERIDQNNYGSCLRCQRKIKEGRLKAIPWVTICIQCAKASEPS